MQNTNIMRLNILVLNAVINTSLGYCTWTAWCAVSHPSCC